MRPLCYYRGKAKLAGLLSVPLALFVLVGGYVGCEYAESNITPATVSVRDYFRSDGTHISGYNRRPPGSVAHDRPYEQLRLISFIAVLGAAFWAGRSIYRFVAVPPLSLLPPLDFASLPPPAVEIAVPVLTATARKEWECEDCGTRIATGTAYFYYEGGGAHRDRHRYCGPCAAERNRRKKELPGLKREYSEAQARARRDQCLSVYGLPPESLRT